MKPDVNTLPGSKGQAESWCGIQSSGYLNKKGTPNGADAKFNKMPPGTDIENQVVADIRELPMKTLTNLSYPGDGW